VREDCIISTGEVGIFSFVGLCRPYILCTSHDNFNHRRHIGHQQSFIFGGIGLSCGHLGFWRISEIAVSSGVPISLTVCTLSNIPFVFGLFEFYFALLYTFYIEYVLVIWDRFQFYKNMERDSLVLCR
jgi:hypothetical protein